MRLPAKDIYILAHEKQAPQQIGKYNSLCKIRCNKFKKKKKLLDTVRCFFYGLFMVRSFVGGIHTGKIFWHYEKLIFLQEI